MSTSLQNGLSLAARLLFVALFLPAGISKLTGFAGTVGYISSVGLPLPAVGGLLALAANGAGAWSLDARSGR
jgi:putative oxidoreductase